MHFFLHIFALHMFNETEVNSANFTTETQREQSCTDFKVIISP